MFKKGKEMNFKLIIVATIMLVATLVSAGGVLGADYSFYEDFEDLPDMDTGDLVSNNRDCSGVSSNPYFVNIYDYPVTCVDSSVTGIVKANRSTDTKDVSSYSYHGYSQNGDDFFNFLEYTDERYYGLPVKINDNTSFSFDMKYEQGYENPTTDEESRMILFTSGSDVTIYLDDDGNHPAFGSGFCSLLDLTGQEANSTWKTFEFDIADINLNCGVDITSEQLEQFRWYLSGYPTNSSGLEVWIDNINVTSYEQNITVFKEEVVSFTGYNKSEDCSLTSTLENPNDYNNFLDTLSQGWKQRWYCGHNADNLGSRFDYSPTGSIDYNYGSLNATLTGGFSGIQQSAFVTFPSETFNLVDGNDTISFFCNGMDSDGLNTSHYIGLLPYGASPTSEINVLSLENGGCDYSISYMPDIYLSSSANCYELFDITGDDCADGRYSPKFSMQDVWNVYPNATFDGISRIDFVSMVREDGNKESFYFDDIELMEYGEEPEQATLPPQNVTGCGVYTQDNVEVTLLNDIYVNISDTSDLDCFEFTGVNATLDCDGHQIYMESNATIQRDYVQINPSSLDGNSVTTIKNCDFNLTGYSTGVDMDSFYNNPFNIYNNSFFKEGVFSTGAEGIYYRPLNNIRFGGNIYNNYFENVNYALNLRNLVSSNIFGNTIDGKDFFRIEYGDNINIWNTEIIDTNVFGRIYGEVNGLRIFDNYGYSDLFIGFNTATQTNSTFEIFNNDISLSGTYGVYGIFDNPDSGYNLSMYNNTFNSTLSKTQFLDIVSDIEIADLDTIPSAKYNWYGNYLGDCVDADANGWCDSEKIENITYVVNSTPYILLDEVVEPYPLSNYDRSTTCTPDWQVVNNSVVDSNSCLDYRGYPTLVELNGSITENITDCQTIDADSTTVILQNDIYKNITETNNLPLGSCFVIDAQDVTLDCGGHQIYMESGGGITARYVREFDATSSSVPNTIQNCVFNMSNQSTGITLGDYTNVLNNTFFVKEGVSPYQTEGIFGVSITGLNVVGNYFDNLQEDVDVDGLFSANIFDNKFYSSSGVIATQTDIKLNSGAGISIHNNEFDSTQTSLTLFDLVNSGADIKVFDNYGNIKGSAWIFYFRRNYNYPVEVYNNIFDTNQDTAGYVRLENIFGQLNLIKIYNNTLNSSLVKSKYVDDVYTDYSNGLQDDLPLAKTYWYGNYLGDCVDADANGWCDSEKIENVTQYNNGNITEHEVIVEPYPLSNYDRSTTCTPDWQCVNGSEVDVNGCLDYRGYPELDCELLTTQYDLDFSNKSILFNETFGTNAFFTTQCYVEDDSPSNGFGSAEWTNAESLQGVTNVSTSNYEWMCWVNTSANTYWYEDENDDRIIYSDVGVRGYSSVSEDGVSSFTTITDDYITLQNDDEVIFFCGSPDGYPYENSTNNNTYAYFMFGDQDPSFSDSSMISLVDGGCSQKSKTNYGDVDCCELSNIIGQDCSGNTIMVNFTPQNVEDSCVGLGTGSFSLMKRYEFLLTNKEVDANPDMFFFDDMYMTTDVIENNSLPSIVAFSTNPLSPINVSNKDSIWFEWNLDDPDDPESEIYTAFDCEDDGTLDYAWALRGDEGTSLNGQGFECSYPDVGNYTGRIWYSDVFHYPTYNESSTKDIEILLKVVETPEETGCEGFTAPSCPIGKDCWFYDDFNYNYSVKCNGWDGYNLAEYEIPYNQSYYRIFDFSNYEDGIFYKGNEVTENQYLSVEFSFDILVDWQDGYGTSAIYIIKDSESNYLVNVWLDGYSLEASEQQGSKQIGYLNESVWYNVKGVLDLVNDDVEWYLDESLIAKTTFYDGGAESFDKISFNTGDVKGEVSFDNVMVTLEEENPNPTETVEQVDYTYNPKLFCAVNWTGETGDRFQPENCEARGFSTESYLMGLCFPRACIQDVGLGLINWFTSNILRSIIIVSALILIVPIFVAMRRR